MTSTGPYFLEETISILETRPSVGLVYGDAALMDAQSVELEDPWIAVGTRSAHAYRDAEGDEYLSIHLVDYCIPTPTVIARNEVWREVLPFPKWFTYASVSDWFLHLRVARMHALYYRARTLASYRKHPGNMHVQPADAADAEKTIIGTLDLIFSEPDRAAEKAPLEVYYLFTRLAQCCPSLLCRGPIRGCAEVLYAGPEISASDPHSARGPARFAQRHYRTSRIRAVEEIALPAIEHGALMIEFPGVAQAKKKSVDAEEATRSRLAAARGLARQPARTFGSPRKRGQLILRARWTPA